MYDKKMTAISSIERYTGVYKDLAEILGADAVEVVYQNFKGQQISFPKRMYSKEYVLEEVKRLYNGNNLKKLAIKYDYTERHLKKMLYQSEHES